MGFEHWPFCGSHDPALWQTSSGRQVIGLVPMQKPLAQMSACVQASPSSQAVLLGLFVKEHCPVAVSHTPIA
jgi:hypothetical protein